MTPDLEKLIRDHQDMRRRQREKVDRFEAIINSKAWRYAELFLVFAAGYLTALVLMVLTEN